MKEGQVGLPLGQKNRRPRQREETERHNIRAGDPATIRRATVIAMTGMLMAKLTGFLRELLIVPKFGYGIFSDAYINAFQIPDLLYELLIGGAVAAVITPYLSSGIERRREKEAWRPVSIFMSTVLVFGTLAVLLGEILAPVLVSMITGSYREAASAELRQMTAMAVPITRILFIQTFCMISLSLVHGALSAYKRFLPLAIGPSLYNLCYMTFLFLKGKASEEGLRQVAWGVVFSSFVYLLFMLFAARREASYFHFEINLKDPGFQKLFRMALPTLLSGSVLHIHSIIMNRFANGLDTPGAVTGIRQCITTWGLPYAIFAVSVGNVMLPNLSGFIAKGDSKKIRSLYTGSLRRALYYVLPFAVAFAVLSFDTIQAIFQWNPETYAASDVAMTARALRWFSISIVAQTIVFITNQAFYARRITRLALFTGLIALVTNPLFCWLFISVLGRGIEGIGMAHALYSCLTAYMLYKLYVQHRRDWRPYKMTPFFLRLFFCGACMAFVLLGLRALPIYADSKILQLLLYGLKLIIGLFTYYIAGISLQFREAKKLQEILRRRLGFGPPEELERLNR